VIGFLFLQLAILCIVSIILGERTSFASKSDCSRLLSGLKSFSQPLVQYWAYSNLLEISCDKNCSRRKFIYKDGGQSFKEIVTAIISLLDSFGNEHQDLQEKEKDTRPIFQLNSTERTRGRAQGFDGNLITEKPPIASSTSKNPLKNLRDRLSTMQRKRARQIRLMEAEAKAASKSILVMKAIDSVTNLLMRAENEDNFGGVQQNAERFLEALINVKMDLDQTAHGLWVTPPFTFPWLTKDYADLADRVWRLVNTITIELFEKYGDRVDKDLLSRRNRRFMDDVVKCTEIK
jgi:hypothetical protein